MRCEVRVRVTLTVTILTMPPSSTPRSNPNPNSNPNQVCAALDGAALNTPSSGGGARSSLWSRVDTVEEEL